MSHNYLRPLFSFSLGTGSHVHINSVDVSAFYFHHVVTRQVRSLLLSRFVIAIESSQLKSGIHIHIEYLTSSMKPKNYAQNMKELQKKLMLLY
jgi:hypothetical protein